MARHSFRRFVTLAGCAVLVCGSVNALAAKPISAEYADVQITFGGQTYGFSGLQQQFAQAQDGGRIVFEVTTLGTPAYVSVPQIDVSHLDAAGNHWEVVSTVGRRNYLFSGVCASTTFRTVESGISVRHLYLTCKSLDTSNSP